MRGASKVGGGKKERVLCQLVFASIGFLFSENKNTQYSRRCLVQWIGNYILKVTSKNSFL